MIPVLDHDDAWRRLQSFPWRTPELLLPDPPRLAECITTYLNVTGRRHGLQALAERIETDARRVAIEAIDPRWHGVPDVAANVARYHQLTEEDPHPWVGPST